VRTAVQAQAKLLTAQAADDAVIDLHVAGLDGGRTLGSQPIGTVPLGRKGLCPEFDDVHCGGSVPQYRVDAAQTPRACAIGISRHALLIFQRCSVTFI
jgi:hypothetical protein